MHSNDDYVSINTEIKLFSEVVKKIFEFGDFYDQYNFDRTIGSLFWELCVLSSANKVIDATKNINILNPIQLDFMYESVIFDIKFLVIDILTGDEVAFDLPYPVTFCDPKTFYLLINSKKIDIDTSKYNFFISKIQIEKLYLAC